MSAIQPASVAPFTQPQPSTGDVNLSALDGLFWCGGLDDAAFAILAQQILGVDGDIHTALARIDAMKNVRQILNGRLREMNKALETIATDNEHETRNLFVTEIVVNDGIPRVGGQKMPLTRSGIQAEIERVRTMLDDLNTESELGTIRLNSLLNTKQQLTGLLSNTLSRTHEIAMQIINNTGRG
jgi:hypothetical protein